MNPSELEQIRSDIYAEPWNDPQLFPDLLARAVTELGEVATGGAFGQWSDTGAQLWAGEVLRAMQNRARSGVPFGSPEVVL